MESLGTILKRIAGKRQSGQSGSSALLTSWAGPLPSSTPKCPECQDSGMVVVGAQINNGRSVWARCECRLSGSIGQLKRYAELPNEDNPRTFYNFKARPEVNGLDQAWHEATQFADQVVEHTMLVLQGLNGIGKSHLIQAIGRDMLEHGHIVKYAFVPELLDKLRDTYDWVNRVGGSVNEDSLEQVMARYKVPDVLLLDDITDKRVTPFAVDKIEQLVDERYRNDRLMVVATNLTQTQMAETWSFRLADRLFDEGTGKVRIVKMVGPSYRTGRSWRQ